jgi:transcriptional regulator GlxA family with amidase domain
MVVTSRQIPSGIDPRIAFTLKAMRTTAVNRLSIAELACAVNLSESRFRSLFTNHVGMAPARYLKCLRLQQADLLVRETFMTIKEVMVAVGFHDESHFLRDYKCRYGCTPTARRRRRSGQ